MKRLLALAVALLFAVPLWGGENRAGEYLQQGAGYLASGKYKKAADAYAQAARLDPDSAAAQQGVGVSYLKLGDNGVVVNAELLQQAVVAFRKAIGLNPKLAEARYNLALACLALHDKEGAAREYDILKIMDMGLAKSLSTRLGDYKAPRGFKAIGGSVSGSRASEKQRGGGGNSAPKPQVPASFTGTVEVYGADWCPHCREATKYMAEKGIRFAYYNIDEDPAAKRTYESLGAGGIPLIAIGGRKKMNGFSPAALEYHLRNSR